MKTNSPRHFCHSRENAARLMLSKKLSIGNLPFYIHFHGDIRYGTEYAVPYDTVQHGSIKKLSTKSSRFHITIGTEFEGIFSKSFAKG